jgi:hypothetical protein
MPQLLDRASIHQLEYALMPRTTLTLDPDVAKELERRRRKHGTTLKQEVNELLRMGLSQAGATVERAERFETRALPLGKPLVESFDDIAGILELAEGEDHR